MIDDIRKISRTADFLTLKTIGIARKDKIADMYNRKMILHSDLPNSQLFYHQISTEKHFQHQQRQSDCYIRQRINAASSDLRKGSIVGITTRMSKRASRILEREKTSVGFGEQFIEEKILMLNRHSLITLKLLQQEMYLKQYTGEKHDSIMEMLRKAKAKSEYDQHLMQTYFENNKWRGKLTRRDRTLQGIYAYQLLN